MATSRPNAVVTSCLRNTTSDCADTCALLGCNLLEGVQDTDNRSEQTDKRCRRTDRCQSAQTTLQLRVNNGFRTLKCALAGFNLTFSDCSA